MVGLVVVSLADSGTDPEKVLDISPPLLRHEAAYWEEGIPLID
jgi:hypothetical protein